MTSPFTSGLLWEVRDPVEPDVGVSKLFPAQPMLDLTENADWISFVFDLGSATSLENIENVLRAFRTLADLAIPDGYRVEQVRYEERLTIILSILAGVGGFAGLQEAIEMARYWREAESIEKETDRVDLIRAIQLSQSPAVIELRDALVETPNIEALLDLSHLESRISQKIEIGGGIAPLPS